MMVSVNDSNSKEGPKKKKVTFSICTDKSDYSTKIPKQLTHPEEPTRSVHCAVKNNDSYNKRQTFTIHKRVGISSHPSKCAAKEVKKTLVRNVEQSLPPHKIKAKGTEKQNDPIIVNVEGTTSKQVAGSKAPYKSRYATPELYTSLCIAKEIQVTVKQIETGKRSDVQDPQAAKQMLDEKILSRLNFPLEEKLYKDLISLNICDEELLGSDERAESRRELEFKHSRDPEPKLSDFFTSSKGKEYLVVREPPSQKSEKVRQYNGFSLYERSQLWNQPCDERQTSDS